MTKYAYGERVVNKIRRLLKNDVRFKDMIATHPNVKLGNNYCLESVIWLYYDYSLICTSTEIMFFHRDRKAIIMQYEGFDNLLAGHFVY